MRCAHEVLQLFADANVDISALYRFRFESLCKHNFESNEEQITTSSESPEQNIATTQSVVDIDEDEDEI